MTAHGIKVVIRRRWERFSDWRACYIACSATQQQMNSNIILS